MISVSGFNGATSLSDHRILLVDRADAVTIQRYNRDMKTRKTVTDEKHMNDTKCAGEAELAWQKLLAAKPF